MSTSGQEGEDPVEWWLCSHIISIAVPDSGATPHPALLEEISADGVRFVLDGPLLESTTVVLRTDQIEVRVVVNHCAVREDDFQIEARFSDGFQWAPDVWTPEHLYRPRPKAKAQGAAGT